MGGLFLPGCWSIVASGGVDRTVEAPYEEVFRATVAELRARGFSLRDVDREEGRIVTDRRSTPQGVSTNPVETVEAHLDRAGPERTELRLYLLFRDQVSDAPRPVRDREGNGRTDDVVAAILDRSFERGPIYEAYVDAIRERVRAASETES